MPVVLTFLLAIFPGLAQTPPVEPDAILAQLAKIRLDTKQIYNIRDITLRRDALSVALNRGAIAFLEPVNGKVTGAVFIGNGEIVAISPDPLERQQIFKFTGTGILNEPFQTAILRFTDNTYEEMRKEIAEHAQEDVSADDIAQFAPWDASVAARSAGLNLRLMADLLESPPRPVFLVELNGEKRGWFDAAFDVRAVEEVSVFQLRQLGATAVADIWTSFNQRSEARNPEAVAHENKAPVDIISYEIEGTNGAGTMIDAKAIVRMKAIRDGARVLNFELSQAMRLSSVSSSMDEPVPFFRYADSSGVAVVLAQSLKASQEFSLTFKYAGDASVPGPWYPLQRQQTIPAFQSNLTVPKDTAVPRFDYAGHTLTAASYHDQWLIEGLSTYLPAMASEGSDSGAQLRKLLSDARADLKMVENAGPISLGQRLISSVTPNGYRAVLAKGVWVIHMLRMMLRQESSNRDMKFLAMLQDFAQTYDKRAASTWDLQHVAEKHAGQKLDWFFDQWVFGTGVPTYSVDYKIEGTGTDLTVAGKISQTGVPDSFQMPVPVYGDSDYLGTVQVDDPEKQFKFKAGKKPERIVLDPEMTILTVVTQ